MNKLAVVFFTYIFVSVYLFKFIANIILGYWITTEKLYQNSLK